MTEIAPMPILSNIKYSDLDSNPNRAQTLFNIICEFVHTYFLNKYLKNVAAIEICEFFT